MQKSLKSCGFDGSCLYFLKGIDFFFTFSSIAHFLKYNSSINLKITTICIAHLHNNTIISSNACEIICYLTKKYFKGFFKPI